MHSKFQWNLQENCQLKKLFFKPDVCGIFKIVLIVQFQNK